MFSHRQFTNVNTNAPDRVQLLEYNHCTVILHAVKSTLLGVQMLWLTHGHLNYYTHNEPATGNTELSTPHTKFSLEYCFLDN